MCACTSGHHDNAKLLLKKGANPAIADSNGFNSLLCAVWGKVGMTLFTFMLAQNTHTSLVHTHTHTHTFLQQSILFHFIPQNLKCVKPILSKDSSLSNSADQWNRNILHHTALVVSSRLHNLDTKSKNHQSCKKIYISIRPKPTCIACVL